jgi:hypothetical protein
VWSHAPKSPRPTRSGGSLSSSPPFWRAGDAGNPRRWLVRLRCCQRGMARVSRVPAIGCRQPGWREVFHSPGPFRRRRAGQGLSPLIPGSLPCLADKSLTRTPGRSSPHSLGLFTLDRIAAASLNRCTTALRRRRWVECKSAGGGGDKIFVVRQREHGAAGEILAFNPTLSPVFPAKAEIQTKQKTCAKRSRDLWRSSTAPMCDWTPAFAGGAG